MIDLQRKSEVPGLLVSVRDAEEALTALSAGADVIDVKEPSRGPLGGADETVIADIVRSVAGRAPVTAAMGELVDLGDAGHLVDCRSIPPGVCLFKIGLAGCGRVPDWQSRWRNAVGALRAVMPDLAPQPVAVVYADWRRAAAPPPDQILRAAIEVGCPALLVDTWDKSGGTLFDHWPADDLRRFVDRVHANKIIAVLAGSLAGQSFEMAVGLAPELVAVRTAACDIGRDGPVCANRVRNLKRIIAQIGSGVV